jgi:hypothetical protein
MFVQPHVLQVWYSDIVNVCDQKNKHRYPKKEATNEF